MLCRIRYLVAFHASDLLFVDPLFLTIDNDEEELRQFWPHGVTGVLQFKECDSGRETHWHEWRTTMRSGNGDLTERFASACRRNKRTRRNLRRQGRA